MKRATNENIENTKLWRRQKLQKKKRSEMSVEVNNLRTANEEYEKKDIFNSYVSVINSSNVVRSGLFLFCLVYVFECLYLRRRACTGFSKSPESSSVSYQILANVETKCKLGICNIMILIIFVLEKIPRAPTVMVTILLCFNLFKLPGEILVFLNFSSSIFFCLLI